MKTIQIDIETYIDMLNDRKSFVEEAFGWTKMQDFPKVWEYVLNTVKYDGVSAENSNPKCFVDNIIVNGDYGSFDDYKEKNETDEDFRVEERTIFIDKEERSVVFSL